MIDIRLNILKIKNFKGVREFVLLANAQNINIYGDNGVGKTTTADAFYWLLFGKDSTDRSQFKVKPQDENGNDIHMLQTEVEAELLINTKPLSIRKMQEEKWTRRRGSQDTELTGNTISYWWNDVPVKEGEYKQRISEIIDENIFRMLTNPMHFNTRISWQNRRKMLMEICGNVSDNEVIASDSKLSQLTQILNDRSIDEYKAIVHEKVKRLEKEKAGIPPRIDELSRSLPITQPDYSQTEDDLSNYKTQMVAVEAELNSSAQAVKDFKEKQRTLFELQNKLSQLKARLSNEVNKDRQGYTSECFRLDGERRRLESDIMAYRNRIDSCQRAIQSKNVEREGLVSEWNRLIAERTQVYQSEFVSPEGLDNCPTCGQAMPANYISKKIDHLKQAFENEKATALKSIERALESNKTSGKSLQESKIETQRIIDELTSIVETAQKGLDEINNRLAELDLLLAQPVHEVDYSSNPEFAALQKQIDDLSAILSAPQDDITDSLLSKKREIQTRIDECNRILNNKTVAENTRKRIDDLKAEESKLATQITELEGHKYLLEQFVVAKVNLLDSAVNSRFQHVRFKMFERQINGGIAECCEAMVNTNGSYVPFSEANHAGKVNAGLDCINTLCAYYGVSAPIFIDFRESVSRIIPTHCQIINLIKSEPDKVLRVEVDT